VTRVPCLLWTSWCAEAGICLSTALEWWKVMELWERYSWWREVMVMRDMAASEARKVPLRPSSASLAWYLDVPEPVNVYIEGLLHLHIQ
jgi:hypothetical protein